MVEVNDTLNRLRDELSILARFVDETRSGIDITVKEGSERVPDASHQLKTLSGDLENAANNIMSILEGVMIEQDKTHSLITALVQWAGTLPPETGIKGMGLLKELGALNSKVKNEMMEIFSNMSFHDLSGQKLKKVIVSLAVVETKLIELASSFGLGDLALERAKLAKEKGPGPLNQDIVDKMLKELSGK